MHTHSTKLDLCFSLLPSTVGTKLSAFDLISTLPVSARVDRVDRVGKGEGADWARTFTICINVCAHNLCAHFLTEPHTRTHNRRTPRNARGPHESGMKQCVVHTHTATYASHAQCCRAGGSVGRCYCVTALRTRAGVCCCAIRSYARCSCLVIRDDAERRR